MRVSSLALVLIAATVAAGGDYQYHAGYWWRDGRPYRQVWYNQCSGGRCYQACRYEAVPYTPPAKVEAKAVEYDAFAEIEALERKIAKWRVEAAEAAAYNRLLDERLRALSVAVPGAASLSLSGTSYTRSTPAAQQGQTLYQPLTLPQRKPDVDLMRLYNEAGQLAKGLQQLGGQATGDFQALVAQQAAASSAAASEDAELARIIARAQAVQNVLQALDGPQKTTETASQWSASSSQGTATADAPPAGMDAGLAAVIERRCLACHGQPTATSQPGGGLDLTAAGSFTTEQWGQVLQRLVTNDLSRLMPRNAVGEGEPLPSAELNLFLDAAGFQ